MNLAHVSEALDPLDRAWCKLHKLEARLSLNRTRTRYVKPKGMHWRTFNRILEQLGAAEDAKDAAWFEGAAAMLSRYGWPGGMD
jgi:hypothetical protein